MALTLEQKEKIIELRNTTELGDKSIAKILGVTRDQVRGFRKTKLAIEMGITNKGYEEKKRKGFIN